MYLAHPKNDPDSQDSLIPMMIRFNPPFSLTGGEEDHKTIGNDQTHSRRPVDRDSTDTRRREEAGYERKASRAVQEGPRRNTVRAQDRMPVEGAPEGVRAWVDRSQKVPAVGRRGRLPEAVGEAPPGVRRAEGNQVEMAVPRFELVRRRLDPSQFVDDATEAALKELKKKAGPV